MCPDNALKIEMKCFLGIHSRQRHTAQGYYLILNNPHCTAELKSRKMSGNSVNYNPINCLVRLTFLAILNIYFLKLNHYYTVIAKIVKSSRNDIVCNCVQRLNRPNANM